MEGLGSNDYQVQMIEKEEAKLRFKREQNELRKKRFHDARTRTMGVDVAALDAQVEEKRRSRDDKEEQNRRDSKLYNECIDSACALIKYACSFIVYII